MRVEGTETALQSETEAATIRHAFSEACLWLAATGRPFSRNNKNQIIIVKARGSVSVEGLALIRVLKCRLPQWRVLKKRVNFLLARP